MVESVIGDCGARDFVPGGSSSGESLLIRCILFYLKELFWSRKLLHLEKLVEGGLVMEENAVDDFRNSVAAHLISGRARAALPVVERNFA